MRQLKHLLWSAMVAISIWFARYVVAYGSTFHQFSSGHSGIVCPNEYVIFESVTSLISCSVMCQLNSDCEGLDYNENTKMCRGCRGLKGAGCNYQPLTYDYVAGTKTFTKGRGFLVSGIAPIADTHLDASTDYFPTSPLFSAMYSRYCLIEDVVGIASWSPYIVDPHQWIEARFLAPAIVTSVFLLPRMAADQYVTSYKLKYSSDCNMYNFYSTGIVHTVFPGNVDTWNSTTTTLPSPITAWCVRILPLSWVNHISMRFDIIGYYP